MKTNNVATAVFTVTVLNHMRDGITVHRVGCGDIARARKLRLLNSEFPVEVPAGMDVATAVVAELNDDFGWSPDDGEPAPWSVSSVRILPCVKGGR